MKIFRTAVIFAVIVTIMFSVSNVSAKDVWFHTAGHGEGDRYWLLDYYLRTESIIDAPMERPFDLNAPEDVRFTVVSVLHDTGELWETSYMALISSKGGVAHDFSLGMPLKSNDIVWRRVHKSPYWIALLRALSPYSQVARDILSRKYW